MQNKMINLNKHELIELYKLVKPFDTSSDLVSTNIYAYMGYDAKFITEGDSIIMRLIDDYTREEYLTIVGRKDLAKVILKYTSLNPKQAKHIQFRHVPAETARILRRWKAITEVRRDDKMDDYIYSVERMVHLGHRKLKSRKRGVDKLLKSYRISFKYGTQKDKRLAKDVICLLNTTLGNIHDDKYKKLEMDSTTRLLKQELKDMDLVVAYDDNNPIGFTLNEMLHNKCYIGHKGKAMRSYRELSTLLEKTTAEYMRKRYKAMEFNNMQDHGVEGLRSYKKSLAPIRMIKKYDVIMDLTRL